MCSSASQLGLESRCATGFCQQFLTSECGRSGSILVVVSPLRALMKDQVDALSEAVSDEGVVVAAGSEAVSDEGVVVAAGSEAVSDEGVIVVL